MSKSCCFAVVLAVVCLSVILLSLETDAQPTVGLDETMTCSASTLQQVAKEIKDEIRDKYEDVKKLLVPNPIECDAGQQALVSALVSNCVPLLVQQNIDGSNIFNRSWLEYKVGFNDSRGNYWLGNELLSQLTANNHYKLRFDLQSRNNTNNWYYAEYSTFIVQTEADNYRLQVSGYSGNAGNAFGAPVHNGMMFSTYDPDNDLHSKNCAATRGGGFWYGSCDAAQINVPRFGGGEPFS